MQQQEQLPQVHPHRVRIQLRIPSQQVAVVRQYRLLQV